MQKYTMVVHFEAINLNEARALSAAAQEFLGDAEAWLKVGKVEVDLPNEEN